MQWTSMTKGNDNTIFNSLGADNCGKTIHLPDAQSGWLFWHLLQSKLETLSHHLE